MEYQEMINLLDNTPNEPTKLRTKKWVEINNESRGTRNEDNRIKSNQIIKSNLNLQC